MVSVLLLQPACTSWNPAAERLFGYSEAEAIGQPISMLFPSDRLEEESQILERLKCGEGLEHFETIRKGKDGRFIQVSAIISPLFDKDGQIVGASKILHDISDRKRAETVLQKLVTGTAAVTGADFFVELVRHIAEALDVTYALVTELVNDRLITLGFWANGNLQPSSSFIPAKTPCEISLQDGQYHCEESVQTVFAEDLDLVTMQAESYLGVALKDDLGNVIGNLCVLDTKPMLETKRAEVIGILKVFAARASTELQRKNVNEALNRLNHALEERVQERTQELQERERFLQTVLDSFPLAVFWKDRQSVLLGCNQLFAKTSGLESPLDVIGKTNFDFSYTETEALKYLADDQSVMESGISKIGIEETYTSADGKVNWIETNKIPLRDALGEVIGLVGTFQDISDRKQAEEALKESERLFSTLVSTTPVAITRFDLRPLNCIYVNERWGEMTGRSVASAMGRGWLDAVHPDERDMIEGRIEHEFFSPSSRQPMLTGEGRHLRPDGTIGWYFFQLVKEFNESGEATGYIGTLTDISDRKQSEQIILQQANREILLRGITQRIRQFLDLSIIFDTACQEIQQLLQCDRVGIFKFYPESNFNDGEFVAESVVDGFSSAKEVPIHDHCFGENYAPAYAQGRMQVVNDIDNAGLTDCHRDILAQFQVRANLVIPLLCGNNLWGLLCIHQCAHTREWHEHEINLIQEIGIQLAIAIQQANLFEQSQQEIAERKQAQQELTETNQQLARATRLKDEFLA
ncbi:MAG: PAS domain S-box protein, partial [Pseudanabaena sp. ELA645]